MNWSEVKRCPVWRVLGVTECDDCDTKNKCWGDDSILPEPYDREMDDLMTEYPDNAVSTIEKWMKDGLTLNEAVDKWQSITYTVLPDQIRDLIKEG